jgi:RNA polymerase sigma-70 factor (ECF subfamily)
VTKRTDRHLLKSLRSGRSEAYAELVHGHYQSIYRFLVRMARDVHRAEDLTQETFTTAWERIDTFEGRSTLATWLHRIAYTKFIDGQRTERRDITIRDRHTSSSVAADDPFETAMAVDEARRLHRAIDQLDSGERAVLVLHYLQGLSYREMAAVLDLPTGTVKWRTSEALNVLRILLGEEFREHAIPKSAELEPVS